MEKKKDDIHKLDGEPAGYPSNPPSDDIFERFEEEEDIDPEFPYQKKSPLERSADEFTDDLVLGELDVPGSELDDDDEIIGNEDEENNYYSLGGDERP